MAICQRCGADDLLTSDLCGSAGCIYCCGTLVDEYEATAFKSISQWEEEERQKKKCKYCDKPSVTDKMCVEHYLKYNSILYKKVN